MQNNAESKITIIICFSYTGNQKYVFNSEYLRTDLRRIISFSYNHVRCPLENTYLITDLSPSTMVRDDILTEFQNEVLKYLSEKNIHPTNIPKVNLDQPCPALRWIQELCPSLYDEVLNDILPVIRSSNVVEFSNLFTNFLSIRGEQHFDQLLSLLFSQKFTHLFFYYTGHGIKTWTKNTVSLIIPGIKGKAEFYTQESLQQKFNEISQSISGLIIFDCCHAEHLIKLPYKITFPLKDTIRTQVNLDSPHNIIYVSSTRNDQTCGFYTAPNDPYGGSLFTYYFIQFLSSIGHQISLKKKCWRKLLKLTQLEQIEHKVQIYRDLAEKKPQNMTIGLTNKDTVYLPMWLFQNQCLRLVEDI